MGKATGAFLILAGIGTAALVLPAVDKNAENQLAEVVRIATGGSATPQEPTRTTVAAAIPAPVPAVRPAAPSLAPAVAAPVRPTQPALAATPATNPIVVSSVPAPSEQRQAGEKDSRSQALARDIQRELKRVGCYDGDASGEWNASTRKAMKLFIDRVNATLPIDSPDHILKTLVQGHPGNACSGTCPAGQSLAGEGRCVPTSVLAQRDGTLAKRRVASTDASADLASRSPSDRAPAVAPSKAQVAAAPPASSSSWSTVTSAADAAPPVIAVMPGRMAIGGPRTEQGSAGPAAASPPIAPAATAKPKQVAAVDPNEKDDASTRAPARKTVSAPDRADPPKAAVRRPSPPVVVYRPAPPVVRYVAPSWSPPPTRRFGPHIFTDQQRWVR